MRRYKKLMEDFTISSLIIYIQKSHSLIRSVLHSVLIAKYCYLHVKNMHAYPSSLLQINFSPPPPPQQIFLCQTLYTMYMYLMVASNTCTVVQRSKLTYSITSCTAFLKPSPSPMMTSVSSESTSVSE